MQPGQATILFLHPIGFLAGFRRPQAEPFRSHAPNRAARQVSRTTSPVAARNTAKPAAERAAVLELFGLMHSGTQAPK